MNNGMVADPEDSMAMETSGLLTSMFTQGVH